MDKHEVITEQSRYSQDSDRPDRHNVGRSENVVPQSTNAKTMRDYSSVPDEMKSFKQWILWKLVKGKDENNGEVKYSKVPYYVYIDGDGECKEDYAKTNDPATWMQFDEAIEHYGDNADLYDGIGFVFTEHDPYVFIDFDKLNERTKKHIYGLNSITWYSQSRKGTHTFVKARLPRDQINVRGKIEMYQNRKFCAMTGELVKGSPTRIAERQDVVDKLVKEYSNTNVRVRKSKKTTPPKTADEVIDLLEREKSDRRLFQTLFHDGDIVEYRDDHSAADLALCNKIAWYCYGNEERREELIDEVFRRSALMRDKWDERHRSDGATYGEMTIEAAVDQIERSGEWYCRVVDPVEVVQKYNGSIFRIDQDIYMTQRYGQDRFGWIKVSASELGTDDAAALKRELLEQGRAWGKHDFQINIVTDPYAPYSNIVLTNTGLDIRYAPTPVDIADDEFVIEYINHIMGHDQERVDFILDWMAVWAYENYDPDGGKRLPTIILMGDRGVGKNVVIEFIMRFYPEEVSATQFTLVGDFNDWSDHKLLFVDEADMNSKKLYDTLKRHTGSRRLPCNKKYEKVKWINNNLNIVIASNESQPVYLDVRDTRNATPQNCQWFFHEIKLDPKNLPYRKDPAPYLRQCAGHFVRNTLFKRYRDWQQRGDLAVCRYKIKVPLTPEFYEQRMMAGGERMDVIESIVELSFNGFNLLDSTVGSTQRQYYADYLDRERVVRLLRCVGASRDITSNYCIHHLRRLDLLTSRTSIIIDGVKRNCYQWTSQDLDELMKKIR